MKLNSCKAWFVTMLVLIITINSPDTLLKAELALLYKSRWQVELDIRNIKETLGINTLSCKTPEMVLKEIWVYLLVYNLIRLLMAQSALMFDVLPRSVSFKRCYSFELPYHLASAIFIRQK